MAQIPGNLPSGLGSGKGAKVLCSGSYAANAVGRLSQARRCDSAIAASDDTQERRRASEQEAHERR